MTSKQPETFNLHIPDAALADLRERLSRTRFPDQAGAPWAYGTDLNWMAGFVDYWRDSFDWRAEEARLNSFPQYKVRLQGIELHFMHVPGNGPDPHPLLLSHGWPGSVIEFMEIIRPLSDPRAHGGDPADAFHVVCPSIPGYAFSGPTHERGLGEHSQGVVERHQRGQALDVASVDAVDEADGGGDRRTHGDDIKKRQGAGMPHAFWP